jgi:cell division initiation protein
MVKISPVDINTRMFRTGFRGFDTKEVENFLGLVAEEMEGLTAENTMLKDKVARLESERESLQRDEEALRNRTAEAETRCEEMIAAARLAADEMLSNAQSEAARLEERIEAMNKEKQALDDYFKSFLTFNIELLRTWGRETDE